MGPYYRETSQGMGEFLDSFYQHPILMVILVITVFATFFFVFGQKKSK